MTVVKAFLSATGVAFAAVLTAAGLFGADACAGEQPPLFMIRLRGPHTADDVQWAKTFKALAENPGCCDEVWFSTGIGLPKLEAHRTHVDRLCRYAAQLRAKGIVPSLQVQATLGHSDTTTALEPVDGKDWGGFTGRGGTECRYCSCPRQPGFLAYVREMAKLYAAFRPGSVWIDDDLRIAGHGPGSPWDRVKDGWVGCWCPTCLADFSRESGTSWTRGTLDAAMAKDPSLFRRWVAFSYSSIAEVARTIAAAVHEVSPETRLALQHGSGFDADNLPVLRALHEATGLPVGSRPGGGLYYDDVPMNQMLKPMRSAKKIRALGDPDWIYAFCPEVETYPRAFGSRTAQGLFNESLMSLACGMNSLSYLILDTRYEEDAWFSKALLGPLAGARALLEGYRDFNADTVPAGLDVPDEVPADDALKLAQLGIPLVMGVGRTYGTITRTDCDVKELGWTTSKMILDLRRQLDARTGGTCPVLVEDPMVGPVVPRVDKTGALRSVVLFNCRIDRQEPVRLRLRGVPGDVRTGTWQAFRGQPTAVPLTQEGDEALVTIPAVSAWNGGWLKLAADVSKGRPATDWAREEFTNYCRQVFGRVPDARFYLPGDTTDFADDFARLKGSGGGYAIRPRGETLCFIADDSRGHVNAVHRWLERNSDIIWPRPLGDMCLFTPGALPEHVSSFAHSDVLDLPAYRVRMIEAGIRDAAACRNRVRNGDTIQCNLRRIPKGLEQTYRRYGLIGCSDIWGAGHDMESYWFPRSEHFAAHPEYWMLVDGVRWEGKASNFCETNPDFVKAYCRAVAEKVAALPPEVKVVSINMEDQTQTCQCENCLKPIRLEDGSVITKEDPAFRSTRFFIFFNEVARTVARLRPDVTVRQFAYNHLSTPPKVKVARNTVLKWCPYPRDMRQPLVQGDANAVWKDRLDGWLRNTPNVYLREYYWCGCIFFPRPIADTAALDLRWCRAQGVREFYTECTRSDNDRVCTSFGVNRPNREFYDMNAMEVWVMERLLWDPSQDPAALRREFLRRTFGPAAEDIGAFYAAVHRAWYSDSLPAGFCDHPARCAAHYIVKKDVADECGTALARAEAKADNDARREWIAAMRRILARWVEEAPQYNVEDLQVPFSATGDKAAELTGFTRLNKKDPDGSGSSGTVRSDGRGLVFTFDVRKGGVPLVSRAGMAEGAFPAGDKIEMFLSSPALGYCHFAFDCEGRRYEAKGMDGKWSCPWDVKTARTADGWSAEVRIPYAPLGLAPQVDPRVKFLAMLSLSRGNLKDLNRNVCWRGGVPHTPSSWGTLFIGLE